MDRKSENLKKRFWDLFRPFYQISAFSSFFSIFQALAALEIEQVASKHEKTLFQAILSNFGFLSFFSTFLSYWRLRKTIRRLRNKKKRFLGHFINFRYFQSFVAFYHEKRPFLALLSDFGVFSHLWILIMKERLFNIK